MQVVGVRNKRMVVFVEFGKGGKRQENVAQHHKGRGPISQKMKAPDGATNR